MPQHALDYRRAGMMPPGYETTSRGPASALDEGMLARHEHRTRQSHAAPGGARAAAALELRRRQLALLALG